MLDSCDQYLLAHRRVSSELCADSNRRGISLRRTMGCRVAVWRGRRGKKIRPDQPKPAWANARSAGRKAPPDRPASKASGRQMVDTSRVRAGNSPAADTRDATGVHGSGINGLGDLGDNVFEAIAVFVVNRHNQPPAGHCPIGIRVSHQRRQQTGGYRIKRIVPGESAASDIVVHRSAPKRQPKMARHPRNAVVTNSHGHDWVAPHRRQHPDIAK